MNVVVIFLFSLSSLVRADDPKAPPNLHFADVCSFVTESARLTCRDQEGNILINAVRVYPLHLTQPYDELAVMALMRREGFDLGARVDHTLRKSPVLYFQKNGCGR